MKNQSLRMHGSGHGRGRAVVSAVSLLVSTAALTEEMPVSPGDRTEIAPVASGCPTFSWSSDSPTGIELVVAPFDAPEQTVLSRELPVGASSWTPPANRCLPPGQYLWFFRELGAAGAEWSEALSFEVPGVPTSEEVERARLVLERFISSAEAAAFSHPVSSQGSGIESSGLAASPASAGTDTAQGAAMDGSANELPAPQAAAVSAAALTGITGAASAAGVLASNTANGADLVLDGAVQGQVTENQWRLDSANAQTFDFSNPSGDLTLRVNGNPVITSVNASAGEPVSMFGVFGGTGTTDKTVAGVENFNGTIAHYKNLTIPAGATWVMTKPVAFIAVSGTCDIAGEIRTSGAGHDGGRATVATGPAPGAPGLSAAGLGAGYGMHGGMHRVPVPMAISGAGGGGGGTGEAPLQRGGDGGGAESLGGEGGYPEFGPTLLEGRAASVDWDKRHLMTGGATDDNQFPPGLLRTDFFINFLYFPGAGGGAGATANAASTGGKGGDGGGNIYLECRKASFTGLLDVRGLAGAVGVGTRAGGGGGGGGGIAVIRTLELLANSGSKEFLGGVGADGVGGGGKGGNGRMGLIEIVDL
jgi:hypothetical protein